MRLLLASVATLAAVAFAAPAFAQNATPPAPTPTTTTTKHKPSTKTAAYCHTLKSAHSKSACLKRVHAKNITPKAGTAHKKAKKVDTTKAATSASAAPPPTTAAPSSPQTINVPPLPQKTI